MVPAWDTTGSLPPPFLNAAWHLCQRGILRPGTMTFRAQPASDGGVGQGFSVTPFGATWLREADHLDLIPTVEPDRFAKMLAAAGARSGPGFLERAQEAVRAYNAGAFLATCTMCGAAAESILVALAIARSADEPRVLEMYASAGGTSKVQTLLLDGQAKTIRDELGRYVALLKYWRDNSAHGKAVRIREPEAYQALALLLRFALWVEDNWTKLITPQVSER